MFLFNLLQKLSLNSDHHSCQTELLTYRGYLLVSCHFVGIFLVKLFAGESGSPTYLMSFFCLFSAFKTWVDTGSPGSGMHFHIKQATGAFLDAPGASWHVSFVLLSADYVRSGVSSILTTKTSIYKISLKTLDGKNGGLGSHDLPEGTDRRHLFNRGTSTIHNTLTVDKKSTRFTPSVYKK